MLQRGGAATGREEADDGHPETLARVDVAAHHHVHDRAQKRRRLAASSREVLLD